MAEGIIKDKDIITQGDLRAPREFFIKLSNVHHQLLRIQNEGDVHSNALATTAIQRLNEALAIR